MDSINHRTMNVIKIKPLSVNKAWGFSKKTGVDDSHIWEMTVKKVKVKKGEEYIRFNLTELI